MTIFICEDRKTLVTFDLFFWLNEDSAWAVAIDDTRFNAAVKKNTLLTLQDFDKWTEASRDELENKHNLYFPYEGDGEGRLLGEYLVALTHNIRSPYFYVSESTPEASVDEMFYQSLLQTQSLVSYDYRRNITSAGSRVNREDLSEDTWFVYNVVIRGFHANTKEATDIKMKQIAENFRFMLKQSPPH